MKLVSNFLQAHPQHDVSIKLNGGESGGRAGGPAEVHLHCHNGCTWEGLGEVCSVDDISKTLVDLLDDADYCCPNLEGE